MTSRSKARLVYTDIETIPSQKEGFRESLVIPMPGNIKKIETIAKWEAEEKPALLEKAYRDTSFDGAHGEIIAIGWAFDDEPVDCAYRKLFLNETSSTVWEKERTVLKEFFSSLIENCIAPKFVTFNGNNFDLPFIYHRAVILGVAPPKFFPRPLEIKPWGEPTVDVMTMWAGMRGRISQDNLAKALGLEGKGDFDGSMVWDAVQRGEEQKVAEYCKSDVETLRKIYKRLMFL